MNWKKALIFYIIGFILWAAYSSDVYAKENIKGEADKEKVEEFVTTYYEAHTEEGIETLPDYIEDSDKAALEMITFEECFKLGVEKYDNIDVVVYPFSDGISWTAYVTSDLVVEDFDVRIPGLNTFIVREQPDGSYKILGDIFGNITGSETTYLDEELYELSKSDEIVNICEDVNDRYQTILTDNSDVAKWIAELEREVFLAKSKWIQEKYVNVYQTGQNETYVVREGDCLWSIAEEQLGDGMYWSGIYEDNRELIGDDPNLIYVGWELMIDANTDSAAINDFSEWEQQEEETNSYSEETDYTNPYALDTETKTGGYLYAIFEANKGCDADGEWFVDDSDRFTYYEVYDPLNDEHRSAYWEIALSEMAGTDKLAQAVNEYHAELFESQKIMMQEKQKEVTAMGIDDYLKYMNGSHYSADIRTKASFEWGNIFTVVDIAGTMYSTCTVMPANFNRATGEKYEFDDLFNTDNYREELLDIIMNKYDDGYDHGWNIILDSDRVSFAISYYGLLLCQDWKPRTLLIEWSELKDILSQEIISDVLEYTSEVSIAARDLLWSEAPREVTISGDNGTDYKITTKAKKMKEEKENFIDISDVDYPVIEFRDEAANKEVSDKINELLYDMAMYRYDQYLEQEVNAFYACQYFITAADENYICIYYEESIGAGMGRPSNFEDAVTISLKTGEAVSLGEFIDTDNIMERVKNYTGTIYTDIDEEQWIEKRKEFTEGWQQREDALYHGYYLYNGRIGFFFDYYRTGREKIAVEFEGMKIAD